MVQRISQMSSPFFIDTVAVELQRRKCLYYMMQMHIRFMNRELILLNP